MKDSQNRNLMTDLYRLIEKYETPLITRYTDDMEQYIRLVAKECEEFRQKYKGNFFAQELIFGFYSAIAERFQAANKMPLIDREEKK